MNFTGVPASLADAVSTRSYGVGSTCGVSGSSPCTPLVYSIQAGSGLGGYSYSFSPTVNIACPGSGTTTDCTSASVGTAGVYATAHASVTDTANASTPSNTVPSVNGSLTVHNDFTVTPPATVQPAVTGRAYGTGTGCSGGNCQPITYVLTNGLGNYSLPANALTTPFDTFTCTFSAPNVLCHAASIAGAGGTNPTLTFTASDTGNASTPGKTVTDTSKALTTSPEMNFTSPTPTLPDAVFHRTYGTGNSCGSGSTACSPVTYTIQNNSGLGGYSYAFKVGSDAGGFVCTSGATSTNCTSGGVTAVASVNPYSGVHTAVTDTANLSTPYNTISSGSSSLIVHQEMAVTPPASVVTAVSGRPFGTGSGCSGGACQPIQYSLNFGLGNYTLTGSSLTTTSDTFNCTLISPTFSCSAAAISGTTGTHTLTFTGAEIGNASTPAHSVTDTSQSLTTNAEMTITPPATVPDAVTNRSYGTQPSGCTGGGACNGLTYSVTGGLGNYTTTGTSLQTASDTFNCALGSSKFICTDGSIVGTTDAGLAFTAAETGNVSTPGNHVPENTKILKVHPEMSVTPPNTVPTAVKGRAYGTGSGCSGTGGNCAPIQYGISGGLGNYTVTGTSLTPAGDNFTCTLAASTYSCSSNGINDTAGTTPTLSFVAAETGNASTPGNTKTDSSKALTVNAELTVTPPALVPAAVTGRDYGVTTDVTCYNGTTNVNCSPLSYQLSNGLGNYTCTGSSLSDGTDNFSCVLSSPNLLFLKTPIAAAAGTTTLSFVGADTGNASTPGNTKIDSSQALTVNHPVVTTVTIGGTGYTSSQAWPVGVSARPYGSGTGCTGGSCVPPIYSASGGLTGYTFSNLAALTGMGFTCTPNVPAPNSTTLTCTATALSAGTPSVTAIDTANTATPAATTTTDPGSILTNSLTVNPEFSILNMYMENATLGEPYSVTFDSGAAGGQPCTALAPTNCAGSGPPYTWSVTSGGIGSLCFVNTPSSIAGGCAASSIPFGNLTNPSDDPSANIRGYFEGTLTTDTSSGAYVRPASYAITVQAADAGNTTTPACGSTGVVACPTLALSGVKVLPANGFAATNASSSGAQGGTLFAFDSNSFATAFNLVEGTGTSPVMPRVTPDGQWVFLTLEGFKTVDVADALHGSSTGFTSISNTSGANVPTSIDIEPQQYFPSVTGNPGDCTSAPCSNLQPYIRYDAWLSEPTNGLVEPIPEAENPGPMPARLSSANAFTLANPDNLVINGTDPTQAFVSQNYNVSGGANCGALPTACSTLAVLTLPSLSANAPTTYQGVTSLLTDFNTLGLLGGALGVDTRGQYVATATTDETGTYGYLTITSTGASPALNTYVPTTAGPTSTVNVCSNGGAPNAVVTSPDSSRMFIACQDTTNAPQLDNTIDVWNISAGSLARTAVIALPVSMDNTTAGATLSAENGCETPVDVKAKLSTVGAYGTRLFVSCRDSDTVVPIDYNTGTDLYSINPVISTDPTPIMNAATPPYVNACGNTGSCPLYLDLAPNPALHFTTGGYAPSLPFSLPLATHNVPYAFQIVAEGGAVTGVGASGLVRRTFSTPNPADPLGTQAGACAGLALDPVSGIVSGTPTASGPCSFVVRVTDASSPGQFVERAFSITVQ
jgi:hypothetical protein